MNAIVLTGPKLDNRKDLYNLSQTCRVLEDMVMSRLYHNLDFTLSQSRNPTFREPVMQSVRELTIRNGRTQNRDSTYQHRRISDTSSVGGSVNGLLAKIPENRLTSFEYARSTSFVHTSGC